MFTVLALFYGDYPDLAERCLRPILELPTQREAPCVDDIHIGLNQVSSRSQAVISSLVQSDYACGNQCIRSIIPHVSPENVFKYPMMHWLLNDFKVTSPWTIWFDDDSYLYADRSRWLEQLAQHLSDTQSDMTGAVLYCRLAGQQHEWIKTQPWYTGKGVHRGLPVRFATGGFWCIRTEILYRHNWPIPELRHRGGDVMLGELCRQQDYKLTDWSYGVAVNADSAGKNHRAARRGYNERPVGIDHAGGPPR